jgi:methylmalonyl-CoA/ethylmalonyl-CoA epimerase
MARKLDHVAVAVHSINAALPFYRDVLGLVYQGEEDVPGQGVKVAVLAAGDVRIELLEPTAPDSPVARFLDKKGEGLHHIAFRADDIAVELKDLSARGVRLIDPEPRSGAEGTCIAFLHPDAGAGVLIEFVER